MFLILEPGRPFNKLNDGDDLKDDQEKILSIEHFGQLLRLQIGHLGSYCAKKYDRDHSALKP